MDTSLSTALLDPSSSTALVHIAEFTDPGCPFAWSAEPARRRLEWLYGDQLSWELHMVGLSKAPEDYLSRGFTPERQAQGFRRLAQEHHMPIDTSVRPRMAATLPACRAIVAVRLHRPELERRMLRAVRVLHFSGWLLDESETIQTAAKQAGIAPNELEAWLGDPETDAVVQEDIQLARDPAPSALALRHKLSGRDGDYRYTCPSYEFSRGEDAGFSVPGFQPVASYEVAVANLAPEATRRPDPDSVEEVLRWAGGEPLATAEVAAVCDIDLDDAREQLGRVAVEDHVGFDGFWHLAG